MAAHKLRRCSSLCHFFQLFLGDSCENIDSDNWGTEAAVGRHLQPLMEMQCEEEEESLYHCWLVTGIPAGSSWAWLMDLSAGPRRGKRKAVFTFSRSPRLSAHNRWAPRGPWLVCTTLALCAQHPSSSSVNRFLSGVTWPIGDLCPPSQSY